jgi:hypothetical protein
MKGRFVVFYVLKRKIKITPHVINRRVKKEDQKYIKTHNKFARKVSNTEIIVEGHNRFVVGRKKTIEVINRIKVQESHSTRKNQQGRQLGKHILRSSSMHKKAGH